MLLSDLDGFLTGILWNSSNYFAGETGGYPSQDGSGHALFYSMWQFDEIARILGVLVVPVLN